MESVAAFLLLVHGLCYASTDPSIDASTNASTDPSTDPSTNASIDPSTNLSTPAPIASTSAPASAPTADARPAVDWYNPDKEITIGEGKYFHDIVDSLYKRLISKEKSNSDKAKLENLYQKFKSTHKYKKDKLTARFLDLHCCKPNDSLLTAFAYSNTEPVLCVRKYLNNFLEHCGNKEHKDVQKTYAGVRNNANACKDYKKEAEEFISTSSKMIADMRHDSLDYCQLISDNYEHLADLVTLIVLWANWDQCKVESEFLNLFDAVCKACVDLDYFLKYVQPFLHKALDVNILDDRGRERMAKMLVRLIATVGVSTEINIFENPNFDKRKFIYPLLALEEVKALGWRDNETLTRFLIRLDIKDINVINDVCMWLVPTCRDSHKNSQISRCANMSFEQYIYMYWEELAQDKMSNSMNLLIIKSLVPKIAAPPNNALLTIKNVLSKLSGQQLVEMQKLLPHNKYGHDLLLMRLDSDKLRAFRAYMSSIMPAENPPKDDVELLAFVDRLIAKASDSQAEPQDKRQRLQ
ncbi:hypothetical protein PAPHI01_2540 [Pancytospora philotis]|nr:hypothetical protein PAPHI01_2540 [Pancytospora philotis]